MNGDQPQNEARELEALVADFVDGELSSERFEALQALLRDRPDLQRLYARLMSAPTLLKTELSTSEPSFGPLVPSRAAPLEAAPSFVDDPCEALAARIERHETGGTVRNRMVLWATAAALLAAAATTWVVSAVVDPNPIAQNPRFDQLRESTPEQFPSFGSSSSGRPERLVVRDKVSLTLVSRLTRTALLSSIALPTTHAVGSSPTPISRGDVMLDNVAGQRERGFLVSVPPGHTLELVVDANSSDENTLAIVELDADGKATGESVCFANTNESAKLTAVGHVGVVGNWSVRNATDVPRTFLLTGSHKRFVETDDPTWYLSDYRVTYQSPSLLCIGWDDSGYAPPGSVMARFKPPLDSREVPEILRPALGRMEESGFLAQRDYDDVSATIRIYPTGSTAGPGLGLPYAARPRTDGPEAPPAWLAEGAEGYRFSVLAGGFAVVRVSAQCLLPNTVSIIDPQTGRVVWSDSPESEENYDAYVLGLRGVCVIDNPGETNREYLLVGRNSMTEPDSPFRWSLSKCQEVATFENGALVGFEDSLNDGDWNDMEVHLRVVRP